MPFTPLLLYHLATWWTYWKYVTPSLFTECFKATSPCTSVVSWKTIRRGSLREHITNFVHHQKHQCQPLWWTCDSCFAACIRAFFCPSENSSPDERLTIPHPVESRRLALPASLAARALVCTRPAVAVWQFNVRIANFLSTMNDFGPTKYLISFQFNSLIFWMEFILFDTEGDSRACQVTDAKVVNKYSPQTQI